MMKFLIFAFVIALTSPKVEAGLFNLFGLLGSGVHSDTAPRTHDAQTVLSLTPPRLSEPTPPSFPQEPASSTGAVTASNDAVGVVAADLAGAATAQTPPQSLIYETSPDPQLPAMQPEQQPYYEGPPFDCSVPIPPPAPEVEAPPLPLLTPETPEGEAKRAEENEKCKDKYPKAVCENHLLFNHCHTMPRLGYYCERTCGYCTDECYNDDESCTQTQYPCDEAKSKLANSACKARCGGCKLPELPSVIQPPPPVMDNEHKMFHTDNTLPAAVLSNPVPQWPFFRPGQDGGNEAA